MSKIGNKKRSEILDECAKDIISNNKNEDQRLSISRHRQ